MRGLINESADQLVVEFDFQLDGLIYRARRTLARGGRSTRQLFRSKTAGPSEQLEWEALADTHRETGYRAWISRPFGLELRSLHSVGAVVARTIRPDTDDAAR